MSEVQCHFSRVRFKYVLHIISIHSLAYIIGTGIGMHVDIMSLPVTLEWTASAQRKKMAQDGELF